MNIKQLRKNKKLSQADLATKLHVSLRTIGNWESGKVEIPETKKAMLLDFFKQDLKVPQVSYAQLSDLRLQVGLTQSELAEKLRVSLRQVQRWESDPELIPEKKRGWIEQEIAQMRRLSQLGSAQLREYEAEYTKEEFRQEVDKILIDDSSLSEAEQKKLLKRAVIMLRSKLEQIKEIHEKPLLDELKDYLFRRK